MLVSEKEIEIERLKTTVISLNIDNAKVSDYLADLNNTKDRFQDSEHQRESMQDHLVETAKKVQNDNQMHTDYQN